MPSVPWIRLYQNWPRHRKTIALRKALGTAEPILCLWLWAAENAPSGDLEGMTTDDIEDASGWHGKRGKAAMAMIEAGFIDLDPNTGAMRLHNWAARAGAGVANLVKRRERACERMRHVRANKMRTDCEPGAHVAETLSLSPDLGTSESLPDLSAIPDPDRARSNVDAKIRPRTVHDLLHCMRVAVQREQPQVGQWNPDHWGPKDARVFLEGFEDIEAALETIEKRIDIFAKDKAMAPWTPGVFAKHYNTIGQPKPPREDHQGERLARVGHGRAEDYRHVAVGEQKL